ncbi:MAG: LysM peptidoglycan-binding domain-containing protein [Proteobacteria bacterium]|nr:MAG: LysM peptidoglycan-binding domain-containing protein [Pseudomonadota bacterium]
MKNLYCVKKATFLALLLASAMATGCSSSQTAGEEDAILMEPGAESGADAVGSIPEDMLAGEEGGSQPAQAEGADPFADLSTEPGAGSEQASAPSADDGLSASTSAGEIAWYEVKRGDTLMKIAFSIYGDIDRWKDMKDWNADTVKNFSHLKAGSKLKYETPAVAFTQEELAHSYLIKTGDTLAGIADEVYGRRNKYKKLQSYNPQLIKNVNRIFAGFNLFYEITAQEMQEAETRRQQRGSAGSVNLTDSSIPSAVQPVPAAVSAPAPAPVAIKGPSPASQK